MKQALQRLRQLEFMRTDHHKALQKKSSRDLIGVLVKMFLHTLSYTFKGQNSKRPGKELLESHHSNSSHRARRLILKSQGENTLLNIMDIKQRPQKGHASKIRN